MTPLKVALIGSHGVGKTTLCYGLASRLKRRDVALDVVHEVARRCPLPVNEETTAAAQAWILHTQVAEEIVAESRYPVVLCDRSVLDNYVYLLIASGPAPDLAELVDRWLESYTLLVHVPIVDVPQPDGIRALDPAFQAEVDRRLRQELSARQLPVLELAPSDRPGWLDTLEHATWERIASPQLALFSPSPSANGSE